MDRQLDTKVAAGFVERGRLRRRIVAREVVRPDWLAGRASEMRDEPLEELLEISCRV